MGAREERRGKGRKEARDLVREREQGERKGQKEARYHDGESEKKR